MNALEVFRKALRELSDRHAQELPRKLGEIEALWSAVVQTGGERDGLVAVQRLAHGLDVASSMLGLPSLSSPSRRLARTLTLVLSRGHHLSTDDVERVNGFLGELKAAAAELGAVPGASVPTETAQPPADANLGSQQPDPRTDPEPVLEIPTERPVKLSVVTTTAANEEEPPPVSSESTASPRLTPATATPTDAEPSPRRLLYVLERDEAMAAALTSQLSRFGYDTAVFPSSQELIGALSQRQPYAMLIDVDLAGEGFHSAQALATLGNDELSRTPFIYLSMRGDVQARLESVRAGAVAYFLKPARVAELVDKLDALAMRDTPEPYRVMIVDGDNNRADLCRAILHEVGMDVAIVRDPNELVSALGEFNPELLLIALKLPQCGGDELAQVVHQIPSYVSLPVVFLSEHWNLDRQIGLMNVGGDALLPLPLQASQLIATVIARVERYRTLSGLMQHDSLTGLLNHSRLQQYLEIESLRALRQAHPLAFAMIDLDHFKSINDQFGHPVGDRVLKNLARFLKQQLRKSDIVGRYGGEEFAIILTDTDGPAALNVMEKLCADFSRLEHDIDEAALTVTFSAGVASMGGKATSRELVLAADRALYAAKRAGRNRAVLAGRDA